jgi:histidyl-tRNA synthetase
VKLLGGPDQPAIGFAMGIERLIALLEENGRIDPPVPDLFVATVGEEAEKSCFPLIQALRRAGFRVESEYQPRGLKGQMKRAGKLGALLVLIVGPEELNAGKGVLKDMSDGSQSEILLSGVRDVLASRTSIPATDR